MNEHPDLMGAVAIVTGAGRGLGRAFALALGAAGTAVCVADIDGVSAERVAREISATGGQSLAAKVDVADQQAVERMVGQALGLGPIRILINNAAVFAELEMRPFEAITTQEWDAVMAVNVRGAFQCSRAVAPNMAEQRYGKIINISSGTVWNGRPGYLHYVTSKTALIGLTRGLANELGPRGIRVNAVTPGATRTEVDRKTMSEERYQEVARHTALGRVGNTQDLVGAIMFLASRASDFMTGQVLNVDGGRAFP